VRRIGRGGVIAVVVAAALGFGAGARSGIGDAGPARTVVNQGVPDACVQLAGQGDQAITVAQQALAVGQAALASGQSAQGDIARQQFGQAAARLEALRPQFERNRQSCLAAAAQSGG
jgi:hypothetical protein